MKWITMQEGRRRAAVIAEALAGKLPGATVITADNGRHGVALDGRGLANVYASSKTVAITSGGALRLVDYDWDTEQPSQIASRLAQRVDGLLAEAAGDLAASEAETLAVDPEGLSTNDYTSALPRRRYSHEAKGTVLHLPRSGMTVVPYEFSSGGWYVVVVESDQESYPVGGHNLHVGHGEIETALQRQVSTAPTPVGAR